MAVQGKPWGATNNQIIQAIKKAKGRVTHVWKALDVEPKTFYKRLNNEPELKEALEEARNNFDLSMLDAAENTLMYAISRADEELGQAVKSSFYILNNKGQNRGYNPKNNPSYVQDQPSKTDLENLMMENKALQKKLNELNG